VAGRTYVPRESHGYVREGLASWYGPGFHGRSTANGEVFDRNSISAAHTTMPLPSYARVTNLHNNHSMIVRVNDRGPYHGNRVLDVSQRVAEMLDFKRMGTARVKVEYIGRASTAGSDDRILMASLATDGNPAQMPGKTAPVMLARAETPAPALRTTVSETSLPTAREPVQEVQIAENQTIASLEQAVVETGATPASQVVASTEMNESSEEAMAFAPLPPQRPTGFENFVQPASVSKPIPPARPLVLSERTKLAASFR
jgi:rare lipoprotein A